MVFDLTLDRVQNTRFRNTYNTLIKQLTKETNFLEPEINAYLLIYYKFALINSKSFNGYMTKVQLSSFLQLYLDISDKHMIEHISRIVSDTRVDQIVSPRSWIHLLNVYASDSLDDHIQFCFNVYDIYTEGHLTRHNVASFTHKFFLGDDDESDALRVDMLGVIMQKFDINKDGIITFENYRAAVHKSPTLLQFLGICIPTRQAFEKIFSRNSLRNLKQISFDKLCVS